MTWRSKYTRTVGGVVTSAAALFERFSCVWAGRAGYKNAWSDLDGAISCT